MKKLLDFSVNMLKKYRSLILYGVFGVFTTIINLLSYRLFYLTLGFANVPSTIIAWFLSVIFAFITNKLFVFESKSFSGKIVLKEAAGFFGCRIATGILDVVIMFIAVDCFKGNETVWKLLSNVIVIILNYIGSKIFVFKKQ